MTPAPGPLDDLEVEGHLIPAAELTWVFGPSGGPGGQHANRSQTRAELRFDLGRSSAFPAELRQRMLEALGARAVDGVVTVVADRTRSQWRNRQEATRRLRELLGRSMRTRPERRPTRPGPGARARRLEQKRRRGDVKRLRRRPDEG